MTIMKIEDDAAEKAMTKGKIRDSYHHEKRMGEDRLSDADLPNGTLRELVKEVNGTSSESNSESGSEFRSVHAAQQLLQQYQESRNLDIIRQAQISRFDVALCVFEGETEAYREIQIKELYSILSPERESSPDETSLNKILAMLAIMLLSKIAEFDSPLSLEDATSVVLDVLGDEMLPLLRERAIESLEQRKGIVASYVDQDSAWVNYSRRVCSCLGV